MKIIHLKIDKSSIKNKFLFLIVIIVINFNKNKQCQNVVLTLPKAPHFHIFTYRITIISHFSDFILFSSIAGRQSQSSEDKQYHDDVSN